ncbi:MAG: hypothetical protein JXR56_02930 [Candidatus Cloacimonetes bacterium]|nr:hypothetical protein [Candidatus Cloacimonadota bacterium]
MKKIIGLAVIVMLLTGCGLTKSKDADEYEIKDLFAQISYDFLTFNLDGIYNNYAYDYFHNGGTIFTEENWWRDKRDSYFQVVFENIRVNRIGDYFAEVSFIVTFSGDSGDFVYEEPGTFGNLSYLYKNNGVWQFYGNQNE